MRNHPGLHPAGAADRDVRGHHQSARRRTLHSGAWNFHAQYREQWMGVPFRKPVTMMRETVEALRAIFRGEKVTMDGKMVKINGFRLDAPIEHAPKIYIGAQGAKMLRIAGELGDGVIVNFITPETVAPMLDHTRDGMRSA